MELLWSHGATVLAIGVVKVARLLARALLPRAPRPPFDLLVITASDPEQAAVFAQLVAARAASLPRGLSVRCYSDPPGGRVGSGGGTLVALAMLLRDELGLDAGAAMAPAELARAVCALASSSPARLLAFFRQRRVLIVHAGGESRRLPTYVPEGKLFAPVPHTGALPPGMTTAPVILDLMLCFFERYPWSAAGEVLLASGDALVDFETEGLFAPLDVNAPSHRAQAEVRGSIVGFGCGCSFAQGSRHGVFQLAPARIGRDGRGDDDGTSGGGRLGRYVYAVDAFHQKESAAVLARVAALPPEAAEAMGVAGAAPKGGAGGPAGCCALDIGLFSLAPEWCAAFVGFGCERAAPPRGGGGGDGGPGGREGGLTAIAGESAASAHASAREAASVLEAVLSPAGCAATAAIEGARSADGAGVAPLGVAGAAAARISFDFYLEAVSAAVAPLGAPSAYSAAMRARGSSLPDHLLVALHARLAPMRLRAALPRGCSFVHFGSLVEFPHACALIAGRPPPAPRGGGGGGGERLVAAAGGAQGLGPARALLLNCEGVDVVRLGADGRVVGRACTPDLAAAEAAAAAVEASAAAAAPQPGGAQQPRSAPAAASEGAPVECAVDSARAASIIERCAGCSLALAAGTHLLSGLRGLQLTEPLPAGFCLDGRPVPAAAVAALLSAATDAPAAGAVTTGGGGGSSTAAAAGAPARHALLVYHCQDSFKPVRTAADATFCGRPLLVWLEERALSMADIVPPPPQGAAAASAPSAPSSAPPAFDLWDAPLFAHAPHAPSASFARGYWDAEWARSTGWADSFRACSRLSLRQANRLESAAERDARRTLAFRRSLAMDEEAAVPF